jgi:hypothetical protein
MEYNYNNQTNFKVGLCIEERNGPYETRNDKENGSEVVERHVIIFDNVEEMDLYTIYGIKPKTRKWKKQQPYCFQYHDLENLVDFINLVIGRDEQHLSFSLFHYEQDEINTLESVMNELETGILNDYVLCWYDDEKMNEKRLREFLDVLTGYIQ